MPFPRNKWMTNREGMMLSSLMFCRRGSMADDASFAGCGHSLGGNDVFDRIVRCETRITGVW